MSGLLSGYPSMHLTRFNTNSTKSLWIGFLKNLNKKRENQENKEIEENKEKKQVRKLIQEKRTKKN